MNLNEFINHLTNFKIKHPNEIEVSNMPVEVRIETSYGIYSMYDIEDIVLEDNTVAVMSK